MTPDEQDRLARSRFTILAVLRAAGVVDMIAGILIWKSDLLRAGGWPQVGLPIFAVGMVASLVIPPILARAWRTPR